MVEEIACGSHFPRKPVHPGQKRLQSRHLGWLPACAGETRWSDLACLGRKGFPPEGKAAKLIFLGLYWEQISRSFRSDRVVGWVLFLHLFQPKYLTFPHY
jgi:hypothetical protein